MRAHRNQLRIVGGEWRGRRLTFPELPGVRPSPDRLRETLFNWLAPFLPGARCLDLFAGSGALGLESLSRGAEEVVFVDRNRMVVSALQEHLQTLGGEARGVVHGADAGAFLRGATAGFDIVFLDPPFHQEWLVPMLDALRGHLKSGHRIHAEYDRAETPAWPEDIQVLKSTRAGRVCASLLEFRAETP